MTIINNVDLTLRSFLDRREQDLLKQIDRLHSQLSPLEAELAEVRRSKAAIGMPTAATLSVPLMGTLGPDGNLRIDLGTIGDPAPPTDEEDIELLKNTTLAQADELQRYANLTMKQLVIKALEEHFQHGATTRNLIDFFRDAWGRAIERTNLSPQITRLYHEGKIGRIDSNHRWFRRMEDYSGTLRPYWRGHTGQLLYQLPSEAWPTDEPCRFAGDEPLVILPDED